MYKVSRLDLTALDEQTLRLYEELTEPRFACCLRSENPYGISNSKLIAIGAAREGRPAGLALACSYPGVRQGEIYSLYVLEPFRHQNLGTRILTLLQQELFKEKASLFTFIYETETPTAPYLEKIFQKLQWKKPRPFLVRCLFDGFAFNPPWIRQEHHYPEGFTEFPWSELTDDERNTLKTWGREGTYPPSVSPLKNESLIEPINSLGLRYNGEIAGWMITHRIAPDTIRFTSLFIHRDYHFLGPAITLLVHAIHLQKRSPVRWAVLEVNFELTTKGWYRFLERRLIPYADKVTRFNQAWHHE